MKEINQNAPVVARKGIWIDASPDQVWNVLSDINQWQVWNPDISFAEAPKFLIADQSFTWKSGGMKITSTIHTANPNRALGWTGKVMGVFAIHNWRLNDEKNGTRLVVEESMEGFLAGLMKKSFQKTLDKGMSRWLDFLKAEAESNYSLGKAG